MAQALQAKLMAEAAGVAAKADAYNKLDRTGRMIMILQALPPVIDSFGEAGTKMLAPFAEAMGKGLGNIKEVRLIDMGAGASNNKMLSNFAATPIETLFKTYQQLRATQAWPVIEGLLKQAGVNIDSLAAAVAANTAVAAPPAAPVAGTAAIEPPAAPPDVAA
jgi:uncharacterized membrane protein YqiK